MLLPLCCFTPSHRVLPRWGHRLWSFLPAEDAERGEAHRPRGRGVAESGSQLSPPRVADDASRLPLSVSCRPQPPNKTGVPKPTLQMGTRTPGKRKRGPRCVTWLVQLPTPASRPRALRLISGTWACPGSNVGNDSKDVPERIPPRLSNVSECAGGVAEPPQRSVKTSGDRGKNPECAIRVPRPEETTSSRRGLFTPGAQKTGRLQAVWTQTKPHQTESQTPPDMPVCVGSWGAPVTRAVSVNSGPRGPARVWLTEAPDSHSGDSAG